METLAPGSAPPANADNTANANATEADAGVAAADSDGSAPSVPEADTPAPKKDPVQERIDKLTREKYDAYRDRDRKDYELERVNARLAELETAKQEQVAPANDFPTLEQFGYDEGKFQAAVAAHFKNLATTEARTAAQEQIRAEREAASREQANKSWSAKEAELIKSKPDYVDKVRNAATLPITKEIQQELMGSEFGPQVALHLVENPEKAHAIMAMPLSAQLREIGRIEAKFEAEKAKPPAVSKAPPPVSKVDVDDAPTTVRVDTAESDGLSDREWTRRRNAQEQARLRKIRGS